MKKSYQEYLQSAHWKELKQQKEKTRSKRCAICGALARIDCHHLRYGDLFNVEPKDLRWLCRRCHDLVHELIRSGKLRYKSESHHSRFASTKVAVAKALGVPRGERIFGNEKFMS